MNILLGVTGSVAAIKTAELVKGLAAHDPTIKLRIIVTQRGKHFLSDEDLRALDSHVEQVFHDEHEWVEWKQKGDPVLHIELRKWADVFVIAPLSANTLAKMAGGICDNMLTSVVRAWDPQKRMIVCPAMNTFMWDNAFTRRHLNTIQEIYGADIVPPKDDYLLACGDRGTGAMANIPVIVAEVFNSK